MIAQPSARVKGVSLLIFAAGAETARAAAGCRAVSVLGPPAHSSMALNSASLRTGMPRASALVSLLPAFSPART